MGLVISSSTIITNILTDLTIAREAETIANLFHPKTSSTFTVTVRSYID
jgi:hypothetical protein